jgi:hypothetical protein
VYWTSRYSIDRPIAFQRLSRPSLVALHSRAKVAVMAAMGSKSREVIYGGRIIGAKIRAEGAREAAQKADRAAAESLVDPDGSLWGTGAAVTDHRAMPQRWLCRHARIGFGLRNTKAPCHTRMDRLDHGVRAAPWSGKIKLPPDAPRRNRLSIDGLVNARTRGELSCTFVLIGMKATVGTST